MKIYRHGDVLLKETARIPKGAKPLKDKVLAYGEVTGHSHRFENPGEIERYQFEDRLFLSVLKPSKLVHEEHKPLLIDGGMYEQIQEREYDYAEEEMRAVVD